MIFQGPFEEIECNNSGFQAFYMMKELGLAILCCIYPKTLEVNNEYTVQILQGVHLPDGAELHHRPAGDRRQSAERDPAAGGGGAPGRSAGGAGGQRLPPHTHQATQP